MAQVGQRSEGGAFPADDACLVQRMSVQARPHWLTCKSYLQRYLQQLPARVTKTARGATSSTRDPGGMRFRSPGSATVLCASALSHCASIRMSIPTSKPEQRPLFSFGVIADVQWADADDGSNYDKTVVRRCIPCACHAHDMRTSRTCSRMRRYRGAFRTLGRAVDWWDLPGSNPHPQEAEAEAEAEAEP